MPCTDYIADRLQERQDERYRDGLVNGLCAATKLLRQQNILLPRPLDRWADAHERRDLAERERDRAKEALDKARDEAHRQGMQIAPHHPGYARWNAACDAISKAFSEEYAAACAMAAMKQ